MIFSSFHQFVNTVHLFITLFKCCAQSLQNVVFVAKDILVQIGVPQDGDLMTWRAISRGSKLLGSVGQPSDIFCTSILAQAEPFSHLNLWHTLWFHAEKMLKTLTFWKLLSSPCKSGSRPQKSPKKAQKTDHSIAIYSNFWIGMVYFGCHRVNPHVQTVQNIYGKGG